ncbi:hypothetical protein JCM19046_295 [Bacillus sp. JCM 19046]|uniref:Uncharacterized protein n=1 Tax=Shouchella xiaoxiensis TaxID=766895 RepID=A0ABS2SSC2_9BACI|nr:YtzH-like family protein [Shouchella xiaoxiensis]MBM7838409.1 hypothetical protein [Shouchella xiaoxiensis]GAF15309.1 hypothetical protein JCM19045_4670 [Bacillus sp. JCM 19045]GAF15891.1 hypothetical protein JCM19046_295 [Bacillus sp. JCM 19046]
MPLSNKHKIGLVIDLLENQKSAHFLTRNEQSQLNHLLAKLSSDQNLDPELITTIDEIASASTTNTMDHLAVEHWLSEMSHYV